MRLIVLRKGIIRKEHAAQTEIRVTEVGVQYIFVQSLGHSLVSQFYQPGVAEPALISNDVCGACWGSRKLISEWMNS